ncbi:hypothetical protein [Streptomyces tremellae]|uniref:Lipoprotein n=1 Tax=Streptomyces tremellae TaxID=1124239 RepID=A0ABP7FEX8_9ACTN
MRSRLLALRAASAAVILVAAPVCGATSAQAHDGVTATVTPTAIAAQGQVQIKVDGCRDGRAKVTSSAFAEAVTVSGSQHTMYGDVSIKSWMAAGGYDISVDCDGHHHGNVGHFQVVGGGHDHPAPHAPVHAGGGGTAVVAADAGNARAEGSTQSGPGTPFTLAGLALAGVAAVTVAYRTTQRRRAAASAARDAD